MVNFLRECKVHDLKHLPAAHLNRFKDELSKTEKYLKPVIADDGVLIQADDLLNLVIEKGKEDKHILLKTGPDVADHDTLSALTHTELVGLVSKLVTERDSAVVALQDKQNECDQLAAQFEGHCELMERILDKKWDIDDPSEVGREATSKVVVLKSGEDTHDHDAHYYASYAHHGMIFITDQVYCANLDRYP